MQEESDLMMLGWAGCRLDGGVDVWGGVASEWAVVMLVGGRSGELWS